jgi:cytochrome-b5 reductase
LLHHFTPSLQLRYSKFKYHFTLDRPNDGWSGSTGFITADMISAHLPPPGDDTLILMCGPPPMVKFACIENLKKLGYTDDMMFDF